MSSWKRRWRLGFAHIPQRAMSAKVADPFGVRINDVGNRFCEFKIIRLNSDFAPMNPA
jgi:hypothetical protein